MKKTYDALVIPTGETTSGDRSFPVSKEAIKLFDSGRFGHIFVTGGHGGFANVIPNITISEADETVEYLIRKGVHYTKIFYDNRSLETLGNFTFPLVDPMNGNPKLSEFKKMLVIGKEGHMWRARDYANLVFDVNNDVNFYTIPGKHNDGIMARVYHKAFMNALKENKGAEKAHDFLIKNHPFYSEGWYDKSPLKRKAETAVKGLSWLVK